MEDNSIHGWSVSQCTSKDFKAGVTCSVQRPNQLWHVTVKEFQCGDNVYCGVVLDVIQPATELQSFRTMVSLINKIDVNKTIRIDQFVKYAHGSVRFSVPRLLLLKDLLDPSSGFLMDDTIYFEASVPFVASPYHF
ncbi:uncharacterized protein LOC130720469 isoform X2 [Lotus japonicus]|nr:uncharacterized protein LOC130720469 isoform X2 [Lotus japonicus]